MPLEEFLVFTSTIIPPVSIYVTLNFLKVIINCLFISDLLQRAFSSLNSIVVYV